MQYKINIKQFVKSRNLKLLLKLNGKHNQL